MTPLETVKGNLALLETAREKLSEKVLYEFSELARVLYDDVGEEIFGEETAELFRRNRAVLRADVAAVHDGAPSEYLPLLKQQDEATESFVTSAFSTFFSERVRHARGPLFPWKERHTGARIAYVPAGSAETAYLALAARREDVSVLYAELTRETTELLLAGRADYALVPYASADGEPLLGVCRLLSGGDLFLAALVTVPREEGRLVYALLSAEPAPFLLTGQIQIAIRLTAENHAHLGRMLAAFPAFGYTQSDFLPEREEYGRVCGRVTLTGDGDAVALWTYLSFYSVGFSFLGRYPLIEL